jgi:REP element-mobilizing transposase RayT
MQVNILVASPHPAFGELLRLTLEETEKYTVRVAQSEREVLALVNRLPFSTAILDEDLVREKTDQLGETLIGLQPDLKVVIVPPESEITAVSGETEFKFQRLARPFYMPDLLEILDQLLIVQEPAPQPAAPVLPPEEAESYPWLENKDASTQMLTLFLRQSTAQAALILRSGQLLLYAGFLEQEDIQGIVTMLVKHWRAHDRSDLARFIRLQTSGSEYFLYARGMDGTVAAIIEDVRTPLSAIRAQINSLIELISHPEITREAEIEQQPATYTEQMAGIAEVKSPGLEKQEEILTLQADSVEPHVVPDTEVTAGEGLHFLPDSPFPDLSPLESEEQIILSPQEKNARQNLAELLSALPEPNPEEHAAQPVQAEKPIEFSAASNGHTFLQGELVLPWEQEQAQYPDDSEEYSDLLEQAVEPPAYQPTGRVFTDEATDKDVTTHLWINQPADDDATVQIFLGQLPVMDDEVFISSDDLPTVAIAPFHQHADSAEPERVTEPDQLTSRSAMKPVSPALIHLAYTFILIPRFPDHVLTGDLAGQLSQWIPHLCLAYGWELESIAIHPDYLQWAVQTAPSVSPGSLVRIVRQQTSSKILSQYKYLEFENPSGDFWAPGFLIISGLHPPAQPLLHDFVIQTRKWQGYHAD